MDWLAPAILIPATIVVLVLCIRAVVRALRAERAQLEDPDPAGERDSDRSDGTPADDRRHSENR